MDVTCAEVDLAAIATNLRRVRHRVGDRLVLAAVKANAYGHGAIKVATMIQLTETADWLGVATVSEARGLRDAGVTLPILKMSHCFPEELAEAIAAEATLTVVDADTIREAERAASVAGRRVDVHLKLDTGMGRIGSPLAKAPELVRLVDSSPSLSLQGIFTHLPISDHPRGDGFTRRQLSEFERVATRLADERGPIPLVHAANSGAILAHDLGPTNMVRAGIMIYGHYPAPATTKSVELAPALRLTSRVSFLKRIATGDSVSYGLTYTAKRPTWIATVPIGYGDGYSRLLSNCGRMLIRGRSYPIAGTVCMDQTMLNLGPDEPEAQVGDEVVLIGRSGDEQITASEIAALTETIPYEVTCLLTDRVPRRYR